MPGRPPHDQPGPTVRTLQALARAAGETPYSLAKATGMSLDTLQRFMAGSGSPTIATVEAVAKALGASIRIDAKPPARR